MHPAPQPSSRLWLPQADGGWELGQHGQHSGQASEAALAGMQRAGQPAVRRCTAAPSSAAGGGRTDENAGGIDERPQWPWKRRPLHGLSQPQAHSPESGRRAEEEAARQGPRRAQRRRGEGRPRPQRSKLQQCNCYHQQQLRAVPPRIALCRVAASEQHDAGVHHQARQQARNFAPLVGCQRRAAGPLRGGRRRRGRPAAAAVAARCGRARPEAEGDRLHCGTSRSVRLAGGWARHMRSGQARK